MEGKEETFSRNGVAGPEAEERHLRDYLHVVWKHIWMATTVFAVVLSAVAIRTLSIEPTYTAAATIQIEKEPPRVLKFEDVLPVDASSTDYYQTQQKIIQSRTIAKRVIERLSLWEHPQFEKKGFGSRAEAGALRPAIAELEALIDDFLTRLDVELVRNTRMARISFSSSYPELAAEAANAVARDYIDFNLESKFQATEKARYWLSDQLVLFQAKVERSEEALNEFARSHGIFSLEKDENIVFKRLEEMNLALIGAEADRVEKESVYTRITESPVAVIPPRAAAEELFFINELKKNYSEVEAEYSNLSVLFRPEYPKMERLGAQMESVRKRIDEETARLIKKAEMDYRISLERERLLRESFERQKEAALLIKERSVQYNILKREVDTNEELYDGLLQRVKETGVSAGLETSNIQVVDAAVVPRVPSRPDIKLSLTVAALVGMLMGVALAFFIEYFDNTVKAPDDVARVAGLSTLGVIPSLESTHGSKKKKENEREPLAGSEDLYVVSKSHPRSTISEACRTFRTSLLFSAPGRVPKTLLITSNNPGEGKTVVASNLAIVLAQGGASTILVDADLRKPYVHRAFGLDNAAGLTDYITGRAELGGLIRQGPIEGLSILTAGPLSPNPPELLDSARFGAGLEELKSSFDFVVFDSAPVMAFADSLTLANKVDGTVVVVRSGRTTRDDLRHSAERLKKVNAELLGAVVNGLDIRRSDYGYSHYYYYAYPREEHKTAF